MLSTHAKGKHVSFHTPGHKVGKWDITELFYSDNLSSPQGCIAEAEKDVAQIVLLCIFGTLPQACPLDVNSNKILVGKFLRQGYSIFTFTAAKLQNNRVVVLEDLFSPFPLQWV